jgi:hypothetical protein
MAASSNNKPLTKIRPLTHSEQTRIDCMKGLPSIGGDIFQVSDGVEGEGKGVRPIYEKNLSFKDAKDEFYARLYAATGSANYEVGISLLSGACEATAKKTESLEDLVNHLNIIAKMIQELEPRDGVEGQLLVQLIVLHQQSMSWLGSAMRTERVDFANTYLNGASKLLARHHETLEALINYRRRSEQRVYVEHVNVNDGGKAIIGDVFSGREVSKKIEEGPHAKV